MPEQAKHIPTSCLGCPEIMVHCPLPSATAGLYINVIYAGRATAGDPSTFSSVTELQYDRLVKWSKGDFEKSEPPLPPPARVEQLPLKDQPDALRRAALEATIGAPLYPGIEMSWNAATSDIYQLDLPFTIREDVLPGDLTKYLSLPWQSDFYMCRSYW